MIVIKVLLGVLVWVVPCMATKTFTYSNASDIEAAFSAQNISKTPSQTRIFSVHHQVPEHLVSTLSRVLPDLTFSSHPVSRKILVQGPVNRLVVAKKLIKNLDKPSRQVKLTIKIIEVSLDKLLQTELPLSQIGSGFSLSFDPAAPDLISQSKIVGQLQWMLQTGDAQLLAQPTTTALDQTRAGIEIGDRIPYVTAVVDDNFRSEQVQFIDTGISLEFEPEILSDTEILVTLTAKTSTVKVWKDLGSQRFPVLSNRTTSATVRLTHHQTFLLAGMLNDETRETETGLPILGDIPVIGQMFKSTQMEWVKTDIVFMITPEIL